MKSERVIGILGGMGPEATIDLYAKITQHTDAEVDQDHLHVIVDSNPKIPSRQAAILEGGEDPTGALCETARNLERAGADFLVIPCNSAHVFLSPIKQSVNIPVLSMVEETINAVRARLPELRTVGLMGATAIVKTRLYARAFDESGISTVVPTAGEQRLVMEAIFSIKAGNKGGRIKTQLQTVARELVSRGAQAIILACTELPLVLGSNDIEVPVVDATEVLALAAIREARCEMEC
jgi:aspartate racemase